MIVHGKLNNDWPWMRDGIEEIRRRNDAIWLSEDLYCRVQSGDASLYVNEAKNSFAIIRPILEPYTGEHGAEILALFIAKGEDRGKLEAELFGKMREAGVVFMQADSKRLGLIKIGWEIGKIVYRRRI